MNRSLVSIACAAGLGLAPTLAFADGSSVVTGAAGGAVAGAVVGGPVGAAVGGAAGAVIGGAAGDTTGTVVVEPDPTCQTSTTQRQDIEGNTTTVQRTNCP